MMECAIAMARAEEIPAGKLGLTAASYQIGLARE
jgi:hypothetical protein